MNQCLKISEKKPWQQEYHYKISEKDKIEINEEKLDKAFEIKKSVLSAIFFGWRKEFIVLILIQLFSVVMQTSISYLLRAVIDEIKANSRSGKIMVDSLYTYITYFFIMIAINFIIAVLEGIIALEVARISLRIKAALISLIMKKMLTYPVVNSSKFTEGKILNFVTTDANKFEICALQFILIFKSIALVILTTVALGQLAGSVCFPITSTLLIGSFFVGLMNEFYRIIKTKMMEFKDKRINLLKNTISNVRFIKLRGLENFFHAKVFQRRNFEINNLISQAHLSCFMTLTNWVFNSLAYAVVILWLLEFSPNLDISYVGPIVRLLMSVEVAAKMLPFLVSYFIDLQVSLIRLNEF